MQDYLGLVLKSSLRTLCHRRSVSSRGPTCSLFSYKLLPLGISLMSPMTPCLFLDQNQLLWLLLRWCKNIFRKNDKVTLQLWQGESWWQTIPLWDLWHQRTRFLCSCDRADHGHFSSRMSGGRMPASPGPGLHPLTLVVGWIYCLSLQTSGFWSPRHWGEECTDERASLSATS